MAAPDNEWQLKVKLPNEATTVILVKGDLSVWEVLQKICEKKSLAAGDYTLQIVNGDGKHKDADEAELIGSFNPRPTEVAMVKKAGVDEIQNPRPRVSGGRRASVVLAPHPHSTQRMLSTEFPKTITDVEILDKKLHGAPGSRPEISSQTMRIKANRMGKSLTHMLFAGRKSGTDLLENEEGATFPMDSSTSTLATPGFSPLGSIDEERRRSEMVLSVGGDKGLVAPWEKAEKAEKDKALVAPWEKADKDKALVAAWEKPSSPQPPAIDTSPRRTSDNNSDVETLASFEGKGHFLNPEPGAGLNASGQMGSFMSLNTDSFAYPRDTITIPRSESNRESTHSTLGREKIRKRTISSPSTTSTENKSPTGKESISPGASSSSTLRRNTFRHANRPRSMDANASHGDNSSTADIESNISVAPNPSINPGVPSPPINENDSRLPLRVTLPNLLSTVIKVPPEKTMDFILEYTCHKKGLDYNSHTLEFPNRPPVEIDRTLGQYAAEIGGNMLEVFVVKKAKSYNAVISEDGRDVAILKITEGSVQVMAATPEKLIERLTDQEEIVDSSFMDTVLLTYRNFMKPHDFFDRLLDRFNCEPPLDPTPDDLVYFNQMKEPTQRRVLHIFKWWVQHHYHDFGVDTSLKTDLEDFTDQVETYADADFRADATELREIVDKQSQLYEQMFDAYRAAERRGKQLESMFSEISAEDVAYQLAVHNHKMFRNIHPIEILNEIWKKDQESSPSLTQFVGRFDTESFWVATEICGVKDLKKRILVLRKFIQVAKICVEVNNFFSLFSIVSGINQGPVSRLKKTWEGLGDKHKKMWSDLEQLTDPMRNWKKLREHLATVTPPMVPLLPMYLKDLIFMNDGNESKVRGMINFDKLRMMGSRVKDISNLVAIAYPYQPIPPIQNYLAKPVVERNWAKLKEMSVDCEKS
ncbi:hypothetical protein HDV00_006078 [Rhizophlyctis rosea]|nr:hypothetical protein HDV00_006078 [Rhizophlyctis rosea]